MPRTLFPKTVHPGGALKIFYLRLAIQVFPSRYPEFCGMKLTNQKPELLIFSYFVKKLQNIGFWLVNFVSQIANYNYITVKRREIFFVNGNRLEARSWWKKTIDAAVVFVVIGYTLNFLDFLFTNNWFTYGITSSFLLKNDFIILFVVNGMAELIYILIYL